MDGGFRAAVTSAADLAPVSALAPVPFSVLATRSGAPLPGSSAGERVGKGDGDGDGDGVGVGESDSLGDGGMTRAPTVADTVMAV